MLALKHLFTFLPPERVEQLACRYQVDAAHSVKLSGSGMFLCLLNGLVNHPELTLRLLQDIYQQQTGVALHYSTFSYCLNKLPVAYFADLLREVRHKMQAQLTPGVQHALKLRFVDATTVTLSAKLLFWGLASGGNNPAKARRAVKSVLELSSEGLPNLLHVCRDESEHADSTALGVTMHKHTQPGDLWVFDRGCYARERLLALHQAHAFFVTPQHTQQMQVAQTCFELPVSAWPTRAPLPGEAHWVTVRVEAAVFGNSQESAKSRAQWASMPLLVIQGLRFATRTQTWEPLTLLTNLPVNAQGQGAGPYSYDEVAQVYRDRWDIEVFFKFVKQHLNYSHLTSRSENGIQVMLYMSLIAALLLIWYKQQTGIDRGWRSVKFWLAEDVRLWTQELLQSTSLVSDG